MHIYIDESNVFKAEDKPHSISCVAALIIPDTLKTALFDKFNQWKLLPSLQNKVNEHGEIKGSKLDEEEVSSLLKLLSQFDIIVEVVCVDLGTTENCYVEQLKKDIADSFSKSQTSRKLNSQFNRDVLMSLSNPLFMQALTLFNLINKVLSVSIPYYVQRFPGDLGNFNWILDHKGGKITEEIMEKLIYPFLQNINLNNPSSTIAGEDYSAFNKFITENEYLLEPLKSRSASNSSMVYSINEIMKDLSFEDSHDQVGLQIIDIVTNCIKRAMNGNLRFEGWQYLPNLIVRRKPSSIKVTAVDPQNIPNPPPYTRFVNYLNSYGKVMIVPQNVEQLVKKNKKGYLKWGYLDKITEGRKKRTILEYY